ncbi:MAG: hypothetical protein R6V44_08410 [Paracoccaceae bacterium]
MNGSTTLWRRAKRARRVGRWSVRLALAEARLREDLARVYA